MTRLDVLETAVRSLFATHPSPFHLAEEFKAGLERLASQAQDQSVARLVRELIELTG